MAGLTRWAAGGVALAVLACACSREPAPRRSSFTSMGTGAALELRDADRSLDSLALVAVESRFRQVEACMNVWDTASELSRANRAAVDSPLTLSPLLGDCLALALDLRARSGGAFEPGAGPLMKRWGFLRREGRLPDPDSLRSLLPKLGAYDYAPATRSFGRRDAEVALDLGGIAKGYALELAASDLRALGVGRALIDLGGNLYCLGEASAGRPWRVGIRDPLDRDRYFAWLTVTDAAVATSGSYERFVTIDGRRYGHIMNPATGRPAEGLLSVTTVTSHAALGDGLATALFVLGPEGARALLRGEYPEVEAVLVLPAGGDSLRVEATASLEGRLELLPSHRDRATLRFF